MRECMSFYVGYRNNERIISYVIVNCDSNEKQENKSSWQQRDGRLDASNEHPSEGCQCWALNIGPHVDTDGS